jgi:signal peptidase I
VRRSITREYLEALLTAVIFATFARTYVVQAFKIPTGSMEQNLLVGDHILVNKFAYGPWAAGLEKSLLPMRPVRRGDVVVFRFPEEPARDFIKRCVGLEGDTVELVDKRLFVNGREVEDESYTYHEDSEVYPRSRFLRPSLRHRDNFGPYTVPPGHYFFLGDNRDNSNDSRFWGPVPERYLKGRAFVVYWSFRGSGEPVDWPGLRSKVRQLRYVFVNFFTATRWRRTFRLVR